jgi:hypothetical protein
MEARYAFRKSQLLGACQVVPDMFEPVMPRLSTFMQPLVSLFQGQAADQHAQTSVGGLWSHVARTNIASMA